MYIVRPRDKKGTWAFTYSKPIQIWNSSIESLLVLTWMYPVQEKEWKSTVDPEIKLVEIWSPIIFDAYQTFGFAPSAEKTHTIVLLFPYSFRLGDPGPWYTDLN